MCKDMGLDTSIILEKKKFGLPFQIVFSKFLRHNGISESILSFAKYSELHSIMYDIWDSEK